MLLLKRCSRAREALREAAITLGGAGRWRPVAGGDKAEAVHGA